MLTWASLHGSIRQLETEVRQLDDDVSDLNTIWIVVVVIGTLGSALGFVNIRLRLDKWLEDRLLHSADARLKEKLETAADSFNAKFAELSELMALHANRLYDEVIRTVPWSRDPDVIASKETAIQRLIIDSLYNSRSDRPQAREIAHRALDHLIQRDRDNIYTARLYLRICCSSKKDKDGIAYYRSLPPQLQQDPDCAYRAATMLRRLRKPEEALAVLDSYANEDSVQSDVTKAGILRDLGRPAEASDVLRPRMQDVMNKGDGLNGRALNVLNTYLASLLDLGDVANGESIAQKMLTLGPGAVELFTIAHFARYLPESSQSRTQITEALGAKIMSLPRGEAQLRAHVMLMLLDKRNEDAIRTLADEIRSDDWSELDVYFLRTTLAELLTNEQRYSEAKDALTPILNVPVSNGEAEYRMAIVCGLSGDDRESASWLRQACERLDKWAMMARKEECLAKSSLIARDLASRVTRAISVPARSNSM